MKKTILRVLLFRKADRLKRAEDIRYGNLRTKKESVHKRVFF